MHGRSIFFASLLGLVQACGGDGGADVDGSIDEAGAGDGGVYDGAPDDGGDLDGVVPPLDAGGLDAGDLDAGDLDAMGDDAGDLDGGADAGTDGGSDAGTDAGGDAGMDAGWTCISCHGDMDSPAPPRALSSETDTSVRGVGAHRSHLTAGSPDPWHRMVVCTDCHIVPTTLFSPGHVDSALPAELTWDTVPLADGATPSFDGVRCSGVYCHGATLLPGGTLTQPVWTTVDGTQAACGTCHGLPPSGGHPASTACSTCHPTVDATRTITDPDRHIDGVVDLIGGLTCTTCHGTDGVGPAPPADTAGRRATSRRGVGAHQSHLGTSTWHAEVTCDDCHIVPTAVGDPGHTDTPLPAELTWSTLARTDGASPSFDGTRCSGVYCHGETLLPGGTLTQPVWTTVDGTQAACGTCHGLPPGGSHPASTACSTCHPTLDASRRITSPDRHIDGVVDVVALTCTSCHGTAGVGPAPPTDTAGRSATSRRGVGAHQSHLGTSTWHRQILCFQCHIVPTDVADTGHIDTPLPAELTWGPMSRWDGGTPSFDGTRCSGVYCHGETLLPGGTITQPVWTTVDGTQAACGTCHGLPPGGTHTGITTCDTCHGAVVDASRAIIAPDLHIDGIVEATPVHPPGWADPTAHGATFNAGGPAPCQACHGSNLRGGLARVSCETCHPGWQTDCTFCHGDRPTADPAPPEGVDGETGRLTMMVGAHQEHVETTSMHIAWDCPMCHVKPMTALSPGHIDGDGRAEVDFTTGPAWERGGSYNYGTAVCSNLYCHGNGSSIRGSEDFDTNPTLDCGSCHAPFTGATATELSAMSGRHRLHVRDRGFTCDRCHGDVVSAAGTLLRVDLHVNGTVEVSVPSFDPTLCGGVGGCNPTCHGSECWR